MLYKHLRYKLKINIKTLLMYSKAISFPILYNHNYLSSANTKEIELIYKSLYLTK